MMQTFIGNSTILLLMLLIALFVAKSAIAKEEELHVIPEPFKDLHGYCASCGPPQPFSVDPLVRCTWNNLTDNAPPQIYRVHRPVSFTVDPPIGALSGAESLLLGQNVNVEIHRKCCLLLDWGVERAAWLEFESPDLLWNVSAAVSEFNRPYPGKTLAVTKYGSSTYRLETNKELYEGVRYTWLWFDTPPSEQSWHITKISLVAKVKPINYTGSFHASDQALSRVWYTGAYGVRLNMEEDGFNSILIERGDRVAIQGDGHPTMAAALVAFAPFQLVKDELDQTNSGDVHGHQVVDQYIMAYPIYWTMSVNDWFMASGDIGGFRRLAPDCMSILDKRIQDFLQPHLDIVWFGWDDRVGNGWCGHAMHDECNREAHLAFAGLLVRACGDLGRSLRFAGMIKEAQKYEAATARLGRRLRQVAEWPRGLGVHAAANAINTGVATMEDVRVFFDTALNDSVNICSHSPFNQYWILQALGNADMMDHAVASIKLCWEPMLKLGKGCFWELFSPEWASLMMDGDEAPTRPSYCHPWSSGVTAWLSHVLGGIEPLLPGYAEYVATPHVSARNPSVFTDVSTPTGLIAVNATLIGSGECRSSVTITVKASVPGFVGIRRSITSFITESPGCVIDFPSVLVNGTQAAIASAASITADGLGAGSFALGNHFLATRSSAFWFVRIPTAGSFTVSAVYHGDCRTTAEIADPNKSINTTISGIPHVPPFPVPHYPATTQLDRESHGDGLFTHGADGYVLFGYGNGTDVSKMPGYIQNVSIQTHGFGGWSSLPRVFLGTSESDAAYLPDPRDVFSHQLDIYPKERKMGFDRNAEDVGDFAPKPSNKGIRKGKTSNFAHFSSETMQEIPRRRRRALGMVSQEDGAGWDAGTVIEVKVADELLQDDANSIIGKAGFWLSTYCVAQDDTEKQAIRVMDLESLQVIAPTGFVSEYKGGVWFRIRYHKSIRLRIMAIHSIRISAVAFANGKEIELASSSLPE